jgi:hypothetical protein
MSGPTEASSGRLIFTVLCGDAAVESDDGRHRARKHVELEVEV